ncbi:tRNA (uridine(54)-C5)-methyltransferase TrmA [Pseudidiomarina taiwanensis]|uniref:tRNA/tmRNA (uracil-C(5))-methyltransferase n=1 Tax=Pseudidiomarina taiwanensis TaxID=337250 RepID=A0A432ZFV6_9GAMM|nr:tRNA (uridine(54)-C5)-methyltransferase TrmA [Pseudidiomarina taiwanensis]RUO76857.1 tRNA (uridine(54)-C5)-methyltransferase TrmA [Pseudidiomarina taiwanensis]
MQQNVCDQAHYQQQLEEKQQTLAAMMQTFYTGSIDVFSSPTEHYRMRAEFRVWHDGDDIYPIMFDPNTREKIRIDAFPVATKLINLLMSRLFLIIKDKPELRQKLFQIEFSTTLSGQALISFIYHRQLDDNWREAAELLRQQLVDETGCDVLHLIGRARKQKICLTQDWIEETLDISGRKYVFQQVENSFTQPNAKVNQHMIEWALQATKAAKGDLLELYCGNGNFSVPLAQNFNRVLATEISKTSVQSARYNCEKNQIDNVTVVRMSAEDFSAALKGERESRRANEADIHSFACETVLVDPPRAGLDPFTLQMVSEYPTIIYISCNPETLVENLNVLSATHNIEKLALFDQFPYTHHMEVGVILRQRSLTENR